MTHSKISAGLLLAGLAFSGLVSAQSPNGFASIIHLPVIANTASFHTTLFVHNPNVATDVQFDYYGATGTAGAGHIDCGIVSVAAGTTQQFDVGTLCGLDPAASNFGSMRIYETSGSVRPIAAYTRVQAATGNGFSVEGYPIGGFANDNGPSVVLGLTRQAAAPTYQSNCFVSSIGEPVVVNMALFDGSNTQLGTTQLYTLGAHEMIRLLDVFTAAGAEIGDYSNVRAEFRQDATTVGNPSFSAFCTVQNNTSSDADFRLAKTVSPDDATTLYSTNQPKDGLGDNLAVPAGGKAVFGLFVKHPDFVSCRTVGSQTDNAEIRLLDPLGNVVAGGDDINSFSEYFTGEKSTVNNGSNGMWTLEVGSRDGLGLDATKYNVQCTSGNGSNKVLLVGTKADDF